MRRICTSLTLLAALTLIAPPTQADFGAGNALMGFWAAGSSLSVITELGANTSNDSPTVTMVAGIRAGDLAVLFDCSANGNSTIPSTVVPTGYTVLTNVSNSGTSRAARCINSYRILDGSEGDPTGMNAAQDDKVLIVFRGNVPIKNVTPSTWANSGFTNSDPSSVSVDPSAEAPPVIVLGRMFVESGGVNQTGSSPSFAVSYLTSSGDLAGRYNLYNAGDTPLSQTADMSDGGDFNQVSVGYLVLR